MPTCLVRLGHVPCEVRLLEKAFLTDAPEDGRTTLEVGDGPVFERRWGHKAALRVEAREASCFKFSSDHCQALVQRQGDITVIPVLVFAGG